MYYLSLVAEPPLLSLVSLSIVPAVICHFMSSVSTLCLLCHIRLPVSSSVHLLCRILSSVSSFILVSHSPPCAIVYPLAVLFHHLRHRLSSDCVNFRSYSITYRPPCHILSTVLSSVVCYIHLLSSVCSIVCPLIVSPFVLYVICRPPCHIICSVLSSVVCYIHLLSSVCVVVCTLCV